jgi:hypothetical protein
LHEPKIPIPRQEDHDGPGCWEVSTKKLQESQVWPCAWLLNWPRGRREDLQYEQLIVARVRLKGRRKKRFVLPGPIEQECGGKDRGRGVSRSISAVVCFMLSEYPLNIVYCSIALLNRSRLLAQLQCRLPLSGFAYSYTVASASRGCINSIKLCVIFNSHTPRQHQLMADETCQHRRLYNCSS